VVHLREKSFMTKATAPKSDHPNLILIMSILASSLAMIDGSVVNVGLQAIGHDLKGSGADLQWVVNAYLLPLSAILLLGGALGDRYGRARILMIGVALFAVASGACALAPTFPILFLARGVQGVGAALLLPNSLAILGDTFTGEARGRAIGIWASTGSVAAALGPVVGGGLIDTVGWRAIFFLSLPLALGTLWLAFRYVVDAEDEKNNTPLDLIGAALVTASLAALTWALTVASAHNGVGSAVWISGGLGVALFLAFLGVEMKRGPRAMVPLSLFASHSFVGLSLLTFLIYGVLGGLLVLLPYLLINAGGYSAIAAGSSLLPFTVVLFIASPLTGALAGRIGSRWPLTIGAIIIAGGLLLALRIGDKANYWNEVFPAVAVMALGMAGVAAPLTNAVLSSVDKRHTGSASGFNSAVSRTGGLIATAMLGGVFASNSHLIQSVHGATLVGAAATLVAAACAFFLVDVKPAPNP
jgi:EmrB/QacA subfamily drug resistance transporter